MTAASSVFPSRKDERFPLIGLTVAVATAAAAVGNTLYDAHQASRFGLPYSVWRPVSLVHGFSAYILILIVVSLPPTSTRAWKTLAGLVTVYAAVGLAVDVKGSYRNDGVDIWYLTSSLLTTAGFTALLISRLRLTGENSERYAAWSRLLVVILLADGLLLGLRSVDRGGGFWGFSSAIFSRLWLALLLAAWTDARTKTTLFILAAAALAVAAVSLSVHFGIRAHNRDLFFFLLIEYCAKALLVLAAAGLIDPVRGYAAVVTVIFGAIVNAASMSEMIRPQLIFEIWRAFWEFLAILITPVCLAMTAAMVLRLRYPEEEHREAEPTFAENA